MGIQTGMHGLDGGLLDRPNGGNEALDEELPTFASPEDRRRRSARRAVEYLMEKRRLRRQLSDFVL